MSGAMPVGEYREHIRALLGRAREELDALSGSVDTVGLARAPQGGGWSAAQALQHIHLSNRLYLDRIEAVLAAAGASGAPEAGDRGAGVYHPGLFGGAFARSLAPGGQRRFKTVRVFQPGEAGELPDGVVARLVEQQDRLEAALDRVDARSLRRRVASPASGLIRLRVGDALLLLANHQLRHLEQARRALSAAGAAEERGSD